MRAGGKALKARDKTGDERILNIVFYRIPISIGSSWKSPALIASMVSETIRWQTPLAQKRRTATRDFELGGKQIKAANKVVLRYVSGNRYEEIIEHPDNYIIDRQRPRQHMSFGFGVHRCVGIRLAGLQLTII